MTTLVQTLAAQAATRNVLASIAAEDCNLAVWERDALTGVDALIAAKPGNVRFTAAADEMPVRIAAELDKAGYPARAERDMLADDMANLAQLYGQIIGSATIEVRAELVTTNSCRKWHADYVTARLITTYVGTGTQWLDSEDAARVAQGGEPEKINTLKAGDVGLFKGRLSPGDPAVHRSPPIANTGEVRLLFVLNPPTGD